MYKKIIVPVDVGALDKGEKILAKAGALLDPAGEIILLNVLEDMPGYLAIDLPVDLMENALNENKADLIIVASHTPDISNYFIGATADRVVRHAKCSVLVDR